LLVIAAFTLSACKEVEEEESSGYEPSKLEEVSEDLKRVTFTEEGARRVGLQTAKIHAAGGQKVVPYASLIYDPEGKTYVYVVRKPLTFLRKEVTVARIDGGRAKLSEGPPAGTEVVTAGAAEVHGAELEIESG
jgi:hypothetical protein